MKEESKMFKTNKYERLIRDFRKNHPQHKSTKLRYTLIPKGQHLISMPEEDVPNYVIGEKYDVVPTTQPVVYGPAMVIVDDLGKHLAIFPL